MSNVVSIGLPRRPNQAQRQAMLLTNFACHRRGSDDVFWLKENAEVLNIFANSQAGVPLDALDVYAPMYQGLDERLRFFPQYYRFLLSICLDLEDLGMSGDKGTSLCDEAARKNLAGAELSDLQRAEATRLFARRGIEVPDHGLEDRLHRFMERSETFLLPNKKAAYELTHIVFYLSEYGNCSPLLSEASEASLEYAGLLAYLDQDVDLLSEICIAMRFAGLRPSTIWEDWIAKEICAFVLAPTSNAPAHDAYHEFLVTSWWADVAGMRGFRGTLEPGGIQFMRNSARKGPLRAISEYMFHLGPERSCDWGQVRTALSDVLDEDGHMILCGAEQSSTRFEDFFQGFSRAAV